MTMTIKSELPGTFYRSPAPGEPAYVEVGARVTPDTVIGVVELMKQFNEVLAGTAGLLQSFSVEDGAAVDTDDVLAVVETCA